VKNAGLIIACAVACAIAAIGCGSDKPKCGKPDGMRASNGQSCTCAADCVSGFCVDGVCCNSECKETCKSCNVAGAPGVCSFVPAGDTPRTASTCAKSDVTSCGLDGTCDGAGNCRKYVSGVVCKAGTCQGDSVSDINVCDGLGRCKPGPATICAPFACDPATNKCKPTCAAATDCVSGVRCVAGSCGPKPRGAVCSKDSECASGFCADGLCCNVACKGACVSCNQTGREGSCWPIDTNRPDPHGICAMQAAATCGTTGACDGIGGCARYAPETVCVPPSCAGDRLNTAGTCNGLGSCRMPGVQNCEPYHCSENACISACTSNADCVDGRACEEGSCGKKTNGQPCSATAECLSNFCVDGVCCADSCQGACRSCALPSAPGVCTPVSAGSDDPHRTCTFQPPESCGTDGTCDGAGACRRHRPGTVCAAAHCENNVFSPESTCNATGACVAPDTIACVPFACNGAQCFDACTVDANCSPGNVCTGNSCGKKPNGALCSDRADCLSDICAQGVCCATACSGPCRSCALPATMGACMNVPTGAPDPAGTCMVTSEAGCGTNGRCEAGACQRYPQGARCLAASCPATGTTLTPESTCDGAGACVTPAASSCFPFACGAGACKSTCASTADCAPPAVCEMGSCGLKPNGASCQTGSECASTVCAQRVCCATACAGPCVSCAIVGSLGSCQPIAADGQDPTGQCIDQGAGSCGTTGFCDGNGGCQLYAAGTQCAAPVCPVQSNPPIATLARTCDGNGVCTPPVTQSCGSFACNGATCNAACGSDADCTSPNLCQGGSCGGKRLGQLCSDAAECDSSNCVDGVCCSAPSCGNCQSCAVTGLAGTCRAVPAGDVEPHGGCTPNPPCGFVGTCDGNGACRQAPTSTSCGTASCTGSTYTAVGHCDGSGACDQTATAMCSPYLCGALACLTACTGDADCAPGFSCRSGSCGSVKSNGEACVTDVECESGNCTEGFCCVSKPCPSCQSCAISGMQGSCQPVPAGSFDPAAVCMDLGVASCATNGRCSGSGQCATYPVGAVCGAQDCVNKTLTTLTCNAAGTCAPSMTDCDPYMCSRMGTQTCSTGCVGPQDCAPGNRCNGGACQPM
jgi:hypothetical protein